jgi:coenzyme F420-reducing hydrogenase gamma subunit
VPVIPPPPLSTRLVKPGYNTPGCPPEFTEKISCKFANAAYNIMVVERYGVKMCCDLVMYKLDIKKQILDLKALYDETLCVSSIVCSSVCPECPEDEEPEPQEWQPGTPIPGDQPN